MELKYIHYDPNRYKTIERLKNQKKILQILKKSGITKDVLIIYVDRRKIDVAEDVVKILGKEDIVYYFMDETGRLVRYA